MNALGVIVFHTLVSGTARSKAADLGRGFFDTGSLRAARIKASSLGSRLLRGLCEGVVGIVVLDQWNRGGSILRAARLRALTFDRRLFGGFALRTKRGNASICGRLLDRPGAFTRTPSQAKTVLRGLVLGDRAVAAAGIQ
jgi:hypothetical protein